MATIYFTQTENAKVFIAATIIEDLVREFISVAGIDSIIEELKDVEGDVEDIETALQNIASEVFGDVYTCEVDGDVDTFMQELDMSTDLNAQMDRIATLEATALIAKIALNKLQK